MGRLVVYFAGTAWDGNRGTDRHLAARLAEFALILYVDPPVPLASRGESGRLRFGSIRRNVEWVGPRTVRVTPTVPPLRGSALTRGVTAPILRRAARRAARELGGSIDTVIAATLHDVFGLGESRRVLFATDDFIAGAGLMGVSEEWVRQREMSAARAADIVIAVSKPLASAIERRTGADVMVIENGVDVAHFSHLDAATPPPDVDLPRPIAGLVGQISERIDFGYLEAAAATGCSLLMIGPLSPAIDRNRFDDLQRRPNVQWVGAKSFESLPSYLSIVDVGLLPYEDSSFNRASFPLKVLEYLAAGLPVVSRDLPAVRQVGADVRLCSDPQTFAEAVLDSARTPSSDQAVALRRAAAEARSWDQVADRFARAIGLGEGDEPEATGGADHD